MPDRSAVQSRVPGTTVVYDRRRGGAREVSASEGWSSTRGARRTSVASRSCRRSWRRWSRPGTRCSSRPAPGVGAHYADAEYGEAGALVVATRRPCYAGAECIAKVAAPDADERRALLRRARSLIAFLNPLGDPAGHARRSPAAAASPRSRSSWCRASRARRRWTRCRRRPRSPATRRCCSRPTRCRSSSRC